MPDGQHISRVFTDDEYIEPPIGYFPSVTLILEGLGATELDLAHDRVSVAAPFLRFLIGEIARLLPFDAEHYRNANPDVEAARLAGDVPTLQEHFIRQGYFERRQPHRLPFDAFYYATTYQDLAAAFSPEQSQALYQHFINHGWHEGRAGIAAQRDDADRWVTAARAGGS